VLVDCCFVDNDIVLKLSAADVFWEAIASVDLDKDCLRVLSTAQYVFAGRRAAQRYPEFIRKRAIAIVQQCQGVSQVDVQDGALYDRLSQGAFQGIDPGEALLLTLAPEHLSYWLLSGDKRCLELLSQAPELATLKARWQGRVICLEQLLLRLIEVQGFEWVKGRVLPVKEYDTALKACFGSGERATETSVRQMLSAYVQDVRDRAPGLLLDL
jgi:hypothetical protein